MSDTMTEPRSNTSHHRVEWALKQLGTRAFQIGRRYALTSLLTTEDVAEKYGIGTRRVRAIAAVKHARYGIGFQTPRGDWLFTPEEIENLAPDVKYRRKPAR
jgi:hypothetical protein